MAEPLSTSVSLLGEAVQSTRSLCSAIKRYKDRSKILGRLHDEVEDLSNILDSLRKAVSAEASMLALLEGPIGRCSQVCLEFEQTMKTFSATSKAGFRDWTKLEFMRGDINEFIDTVSGYKSTILVGLGTINVQTSNVSNKVLTDYNEMIQDTVFHLNVQLQRIDEKMGLSSTEANATAEIRIDLTDERAVTEQCIRICDDARSHIELLTNRQSQLLPEEQGEAGDVAGDRFEAQVLTRQALDDNRDSFAQISDRLRQRLEALLVNGGSASDDERLRLQKDIDISRQCLEVCKVATEVSKKKIYRVGEALAEDDSDQVVVTTLADLFEVKKAVSNGRSAQLLGSMDSKALQNLTDKRYDSRFGAAIPGDSVRVRPGNFVSASASEGAETKHSFKPQRNNGQSSGSGASASSASRPFPNQARKRQMDDEARAMSTNA